MAHLGLPSATAWLPATAPAARRAKPGRAVPAAAWQAFPAAAPDYRAGSVVERRRGADRWDARATRRAAAPPCPAFPQRRRAPAPATSEAAAVPPASRPARPGGYARCARSMLEVAAEGAAARRAAASPRAAAAHHAAAPRAVGVSRCGATSRCGAASRGSTGAGAACFGGGGAGASGGRVVSGSRMSVNEACRSPRSSDSRSWPRSAGDPAAKSGAGTVLPFATGPPSKVARPETITRQLDQRIVVRARLGLRLSGRQAALLKLWGHSDRPYGSLPNQGLFIAPVGPRKRSDLRQRISSGALTPRIANPDDNTSFVA